MSSQRREDILMGIARRKAEDEPRKTYPSSSTIPRGNASPLPTPRTLRKKSQSQDENERDHRAYSGPSSQQKNFKKVIDRLPPQHQIDSGWKKIRYPNKGRRYGFSNNPEIVEWCKDCGWKTKDFNPVDMDEKSWPELDGGWANTPIGNTTRFTTFKCELLV